MLLLAVLSFLVLTILSTAFPAFFKRSSLTFSSSTKKIPPNARKQSHILPRKKPLQKRRGFSIRLQEDRLFALFAFTAAIIVVTIPAEHSDKSKACAYGHPGDTEVKRTQFIKHCAPSLQKSKKKSFFLLSGKTFVPESLSINSLVWPRKKIRTFFTFQNKADSLYA